MFLINSKKCKWNVNKIEINNNKMKRRVVPVRWPVSRDEDEGVLFRILLGWLEGG